MKTKTKNTLIIISTVIAFILLLGFGIVQLGYYVIGEIFAGGESTKIEHYNDIIVADSLQSFSIFFPPHISTKDKNNYSYYYNRSSAFAGDEFIELLYQSNKSEIKQLVKQHQNKFKKLPDDYGYSSAWNFTLEPTGEKEDFQTYHYNGELPYSGGVILTAGVAINYNSNEILYFYHYDSN